MSRFGSKKSKTGGGSAYHADDIGTVACPAMAVRLVPDLIDLHGHQTARALRRLADRAEQGELLGVALVALQPGRRHELQVVGVYERAPELAHYGVSQLLDALLYPG